MPKFEITPELIYEKLSTVMDPELNIDIVSLGLIYDVKVSELADDPTQSAVFITMTLTTPGCPLAGVFDGLVKSALQDIVGLDVAKNVEVELTFDPPWVPDMMSEEAKAELGFD